MTVPPRPRLRPIQIVPCVHEGVASLALHDPLALAPGTVVLPRAVAPLLAMCDGSRPAEALADDLRRLHGVRVQPDLVGRLLAVLAEACLLEGDGAASAMAVRRAAYRAAPHRPPSHAGAAYPDDPRALRAQLDAWLAEAGGPVEAPPPAFPFGLVSPHIDYARGGPVYAAAWRRAARAAREADVAVILATDHYGPPGSITPTRQHYATPLGVLPTDVAAVDALAAAVGEDAAYEGELRHAAEHAVELVAVWLQHARGVGAPPLPLVPVLVGGFGHFRADPGEPGRDPRLGAFLEALERALDGRRAIVAASGDLAHVGPAFGGPVHGDADYRALEAVDDALIERMTLGDADGFFAHIQAVGNAHNVCGVAPIWLTMRAVGARGGARLGYAQCPADAADASRVSVCGVVFEG